MVRAISPRIFFVVSFISEGKMTHMTSRRQKDNKLMKNQSYFSITTSQIWLLPNPRQGVHFGHCLKAIFLSCQKNGGLLSLFNSAVLQQTNTSSIIHTPHQRYIAFRPKTTSFEYLPNLRPQHSHWRPARTLLENVMYYYKVQMDQQ